DTSIIIHSNSYPHEKIRIPLHIKAEEGEVFDGWVAIDFGTTNSCCAIMPQMASNPKIMDIDKFSIDPPSVPSVILYERLEPWKKVYSIGGYARSYFRVPECRESIVLSVKRRLGERPPRYQPQDIIYYEDGGQASYWPHEMAADIIEQMIRLVEEDLRKKVDKCFITYPARFSPIQLAALEEACKICNIDIIAMYPESVAAAFDAILREEDVNTKKKAAQDPYTLMVYDFGGGSIDIAFLHVNAHRDDEMGTDRFSITVLGTDGKRRFGGDDITWLILEKTLIHPTAQKKGLTDAGYKKIIKDTLPHLWEEFEEIKRKLTSDKGTDQKDDESILETLKIDKKLYLLGKGKRVEEEIDCTIRRDEVNEIVTHGIKESICMMERLFKKSKKCFPDHVVGDFPDVILLAGKSCRMKVVEEIIKEKFSQKGKGSTVIKAKELKECVTKGAVRLGMLQNTPGLVDVEIQGALHTATAKVGIISAYGLGTRKFTPVIQMGDPIGEWVPLPQKIRLRSRHTLITVAENTGVSDTLEINEAPNPEIELVGTYQLSDHIPEDLKDSELRNAKLEMMLTDKHEIIMKITFRSEDYFLTAHRPILG
ncbi:MAG: Hsp70 family protein, partial [Thermodesulfobacteriota bacterium]|nr:Hsp70 family protein [Thermodesulfobacteriota bacterium]